MMCVVEEETGSAGGCWEDCVHAWSTGDFAKHSLFIVSWARKTGLGPPLPHGAMQPGEKSACAHVSAVSEARS